MIEKEKDKENQNSSKDKEKEEIKTHLFVCGAQINDSIVQRRKQLANHGDASLATAQGCGVLQITLNEQCEIENQIEYPVPQGEKNALCFKMYPHQTRVCVFCCLRFLFWF